MNFAVVNRLGEKVKKLKQNKKIISICCSYIDFVLVMLNCLYRLKNKICSNVIRE